MKLSIISLFICFYTFTYSQFEIGAGGNYGAYLDSRINNFSSPLIGGVHSFLSYDVDDMKVKAQLNVSTFGSGSITTQVEALDMNTTPLIIDGDYLIKPFITDFQLAYEILLSGRNNDLAFWGISGVGFLNIRQDFQPQFNQYRYRNTLPLSTTDRTVYTSLGIKSVYQFEYFNAYAQLDMYALNTLFGIVNIGFLNSFTFLFSTGVSIPIHLFE